MEVFAMREVLRFARDRSGASSADYMIVLAGLCAALLAAGVFLDPDTQARLQDYATQLLGMR